MHRDSHSYSPGRFASRLLLIIALLVTARFARAQPGDTNNAATWYQRAWEEQWHITADEAMAIEDYRSHGGKPSPEVREAMRKLAPMLADVRRATNLGFADFDVLPGTPEGERVNQSSKLCGFIKYMDADVKMRIADGDPVGAATQAASMYKLMSHAGDEHTLTSSFFSAWMDKVAETSLDHAMESNAFGPAELATVLNAMQSVDPRDPFQFVNGLTWQQMEVEQLVDDAQQPGAQGGALEVLKQIGFPPEWVPGLADLSEAEMYSQITAYHDLLGTFVKIEDSNDPQWVAQQIEQLQAQADKGELGPVCASALATLMRAHEGNVEFKATLEAREVQLTKLTQGKIDPDDLANAAVLYREGIERLDSLDPAWSAAIKAVLESDEAPSAEVLGSLKDADRAAVDQAIELFTKASLMRRCDFSTRRLDDELFIPVYSDGMRRGFALLGIETARLDAAGQHDDALAQLATCFRMVGHLGGDGLILSAMDSQDGFAMARHAAARLAELAAAVRRTGPRDPFGYVAASRMIDEKSALHLQWLISRAFGEWQSDAQISPEHKAANERATKWIATLDAACKWYVYGLESLNEDWLVDVKDRLRSRAQSYARPVISSILDLAEIDAPVLYKQCKTQQLGTLAIPSANELLKLSDCMAHAAADQREGIRLAESLTELSRANGSPGRLVMNSIDELASMFIDRRMEVGR